MLQVEREILRAHGIATKTAKSVWEAIATLKRESFEAAIIDANMPGETSTSSLYHWIQENRPELASRLVFTASAPDDPEAVELSSDSHCPILTKPFSAEDFWNSLQKLLITEVPLL